MTETRPWPLISPAGDGVLVNHVSDTHFGYRSWSGDEGEHLLRDYSEGLVPPVDLFLHTGDITDHGADAEDGYALSWLDRAIPSGTPRLLCMGNHDVRARKVHTRATWEGVYGQRGNTFVDVKGVRFVTFAVDDFTGDSTPWIVPSETWDWVASVAGAHNGPVVLADHYPPMELGGVTTENALLPQAELDALVGDFPNIVGMMCGHMHKDLTDLSAASFVTLGGRDLPVLTDISAMLSLEGEAGRDQGAKIQSTTAYVEILPEVWRVHYRRHGSHAWGGPGDQRVTTMNLSTATVSRGM